MSLPDASATQNVQSHKEEADDEPWDKDRQNYVIGHMTKCERGRSHEYYAGDDQRNVAQQPIR